MEHYLTHAGMLTPDPAVSSLRTAEGADLREAGMRWCAAMPSPKTAKPHQSFVFSS